MNVMYFLVFLLVLVIAFIASYFFRDTLKRIFGGGEGSLALLGFYDMKIWSEEANKINIDATDLEGKIKTEVGADLNLASIKQPAADLLLQINAERQLIGNAINAYNKVMNDEIGIRMLVDFNKLDAALTNKDTGHLRKAFEPHLDAAATGNPTIVKESFKGTPDVIRGKMATNFNNIELKLYALPAVDAVKQGEITATFNAKDGPKDILDQTKAKLQQLKDLFTQMNNTYKMDNINTSDAQLGEIEKLWGPYKDAHETLHKLTPTSKKDGRNEYIAAIQAALPDLAVTTTSPAKEHKEATDLFTAMKAGTKIGGAPLAGYKEWIDQWKASFAAKEAFITETKKQQKSIQDAFATLNEYQNLDAVLQHLDTITVINSNIKNVQTLKDVVKIAAVTALGKIRTVAEQEIKDKKINEYEKELTAIAKARPNDLKAAVEKYIVDIKGLEAFKTQAQKVEDDAKAIQQSYKQLDLSLVHMDALTELKKVDKYILSLGYSDVHSEIKDIEKLKTDAEAIINSKIPAYKVDLDRHVKALDSVEVQKVVGKYVVDLTKLSSLKSSAESIKEKAEIKAAQERSLDSSSGDYVFDSQEIISDTKLEEMISQGKEDEIEATLSRNIDIPKQEIEKIIKKRKEKLQRRPH